MFPNVVIMQRAPSHADTQGRAKTAFVLSSGASLGAVQVGQLRALVERGIRADLVIGTSVGSLNAAWFAAEPDLPSLDRLEQVWRANFPARGVSHETDRLDGRCRGAP